MAELADRDAYGIAEPGEVVVIDAGLQVRPGDLIIADDTGIVVVPVERAQEVLSRAQQMQEREKKIVRALERGATGSELRRILDPARW